MPSTELTKRRASGAESHQETPNEIDILDLELAGQLQSLDSASLQFVECRQETEKALRDLAEYFRKHHRNARFAEIAGAIVGLVGPIVLFGGKLTSLVVEAIGWGIMAAGSFIGLGGMGAEIITRKITESRVKKAIEEDIEACQRFNEAIGRLKSTWQDVNKVMLEVGGTAGVKGTAGVVGHGIGVTGGLIQAGVQPVKVGRAAGETAFGTASVLGRGLAITGAAFALVAVPIDYTLVTSAVKISKKSVPKLVEDITTAADELYCPSEEEMKECMSRIRDEFSLHSGRQQ